MKKISKIIYLALVSAIVIPQITLADCDLTKLSPINYREKSENVRNIQDCLKSLGYSISQSTGYYGQETMKAIKDYYALWYGKWNGLRLGNQGIEKLKTALTNIVSGPSNIGDFSYAKFKSNNEYLEYIKNVSSSNYYYDDLQIAVPVAPTAPTVDSNAAGNTQEKTTVERYSSTNTQVLNIDEPDIAKTNGETIFYKHYVSTNTVCPGGVKCLMPSYSTSQISLIKALPAENISKESKIDIQGSYYSANNLLLSNKVLVSLENKKITGFDISDTKNPKEKWVINVEENSSISDARLKDGKIYIITKTYLRNDSICPVPLLQKDNSTIPINCTDVYYPNKEGKANTNYTVISINPDNGSIFNKISLLGTSDSDIYMSENNLYVSYNYIEDRVSYYLNFYKERCGDIVPSSLIERIKQISEYDISNSSKLAEFNNEKVKFLNGLTSDERLRINNEINNRLKDYSEIHYRELEKTAIVKIDLESLTIKNTGVVPGKLLNQFSMDEFSGNLRVATTIGSNSEFNVASKNDVYVMDGGLNIIGSVKNLGTTERIYSVRFIGNIGYLVTFRQVDPFYVLDLSNPTNPELKGELKIPGYSSYLHPIDDYTILGVGEENNKVKLSLFDVKNPSSPTEIAKYSLDEYWTEVNTNHHAFLIDKTHNVFFIPASNGGYIFSYKDNKLSLAKTIADYNVKRAIYINDNLYILGDNKITVLNEINWQKIGELDLTK
ncbi:beta-propeller domain-containing protein [bacterium]|nr:beta-propeller domain-containing protein [bacterium]